MDTQHHLQPDLLLTEVARHQYGAFTLQQARESGLTRHQVAHRLGSGRWETLHPGVFRLRGVPDGRGLAATAGLLYAGRRVLFSHATAARLHGFEPQLWHPHVWLTIPERTRRRPRPGLRIMRSRRIDGFTSIVRAQPVLSIERTIVDLAGVVDVTSFRRLLTDVIARELVTTDGILSAADDFGGRRGVAEVRRTLTEFDPAFESGLEQEADELFRAIDIVFDRQVEVREDGILLARMDFADERISNWASRWTDRATTRRFPHAPTIASAIERSRVAGGTSNVSRPTTYDDALARLSGKCRTSGHRGQNSSNARGDRSLARSTAEQTTATSGVCVRSNSRDQLRNKQPPQATPASAAVPLLTRRSSSLPRRAVDRLADDVEMPIVPGKFLDHVREYPPQGRPAVAARHYRAVVEGDARGNGT